MNHDEVDRLLGAYLDGELDLATCVHIEDHMAGCEACRKKMEEEQDLIQVVQSETPRFEPSPFLKTRIQAALREKSSSGVIPAWKRLAWILSGVAVACLMVLAFVLSGPRGMPEVIQEAVANHVRSLQVSHLMDVASTDQHTVKPWFAGKLDYSPQVIDPASAGYPLIGGRLDVLDHRNVAALVYQRRKHYINLFIWPTDASKTPFLQEHLYFQDGYHALAWTKAGMNYLAVSELGEGEFRDFVKMIQDQTVDSHP